MAMLVYYNKIRDDPNEVAYQFGETRNNLDRTVTIDKATQTPRSNQPEDGIFRTTTSRIVHRALREKAWPQNGMIAS